MAVLINEFEVAPAPPATPAPATPQSSAGSDQAQADVMQKIGRALKLERERRCRLAAY